MKTTTFNQIINGKTFSVTIPQNRVDTIINRVDRLIEKNKFDQAIECIQPFIGAKVVKTTKAPKIDSISTLIEENRASGRYAVMDKLMATGMSKQSAYYRARKAGL